MADIYNLFYSFSARDIPENLPKGGTTYHYITSLSNSEDVAPSNAYLRIDEGANIDEQVE